MSFGSGRLRFGVFELNLKSSELRTNGRLVNLQPQPTRMLAILASRAGEVVSRDELRKEIWGDETFVDFEHAINFCVRRVRSALGDDAQTPRYIETLPRRGYRFVAPVERIDSAAMPDEVIAGRGPLPNDLSDREMGPPADSPRPGRGEGGRGLSLAPVLVPLPPRHDLLPFPVPKQPAQRSRVRPFLVAVSVLVVVGAGIYALRPALAPRLLQTSQLTHFGRATAQMGMATDGLRIYFSEAMGAHSTVDQVSVAGGEPTHIPLPFSNAEVFDISPDRTELLVASFAGIQVDELLWVVPTAGGSPRRLGEAAGSSAAWSPDGQTIAYTHHSDLYLISKDGTAPRRLLQLPSLGEDPHVRWSPSGRALRFTVRSHSPDRDSQWEVSADGSGLHPLPGRRGTDAAESEDLGSWTADGRYFVYRSVGPRGVPGIWATRDGGLFQRFNRKPVELYEGPQFFYAPLPSADGKKVFFIGDQERRELVRYDATSRQFVPYLGGIFARRLEFSRDGQWVFYNFSPGFTLWLSKPDGSERRQLSFPPMMTFESYLSPDGRQIAANAAVVGSPGGIYLLPTETGGKPEQITFDRTAGAVIGWCANGASLCMWRGSEAGASSQPALYLLDLKTRHTLPLPGSEGLHHGSVSPDGMRVAALTETNKSVVLYDLQTQRRTELAQGASLYYPCWSHDGKAVYFQDIFQAPDEPIYRVNIVDRKVERVTNFAQPFAADVTGYRLTGITPDSQVLATLIRSNSDLYALDVEFP